MLNISESAKRIIEKLELPENLADATTEALQSAIYALQDGEALKYMGLTDANIPEIEEAYSAIESEFDKR